MPLSRVVLLVAAGPTVQTAPLAEALQAGAERALKSGRIDAGGSRVLFPLPESADAGRDYGRILREGLSNGVKLGGFDAVVELNAPDPSALPDLVSSLEEIRASVRAFIDPARTAAVAGTDIVIVEGRGPVHLVYGMRRKAGTSHQDFSRYWEQQHTTVAKFTPGLAGYRQLHADPELSKAAAGAAGVDLYDVDGVALEWFASLPDFCSAVGAPVDFKERAKSSEGQFNDIQRATAIVVADN
jgi:EthD domain